jgi:hypothetical protein
MTVRPAGLQVGSTKPLSRAERRAQAARVQAVEVVAAADTDEEPTNSPSEESSLPPAPDKRAEKSAAAKQKPAEVLAQLTPRRRDSKRPFSTQLRPSTVERLEWMKRRGYSVTEVVDAALNAYLDSAGVPQKP